jgi:formyl-CoA transferase
VNLAATIGHPDLVEDPRFADNRSRIEHADELDEYIAPWIARRTTDEALAELGAGDAVVAPISDISDVVTGEHVRARDATIEVTDDVGAIRTQNTVSKFSRTPGSVEHLGPRHGEHNHEGYVEELELDEETVAELHDDGVV